MHNAPIIYVTASTDDVDVIFAATLVHTNLVHCNSDTRISSSTISNVHKNLAFLKNAIVQTKFVKCNKRYIKGGLQ